MSYCDIFFYFTCFFSKETFVISDSKIKKKRKTGSKKRELMLEQELNEKMNNIQIKTEEIAKANGKNIQSHYAFNKPIIPPVSRSIKFILLLSLYHTIMIFNDPVKENF